MKSLKEIVHEVPIRRVCGSTDREISHITFDSRKIEDGGIFVAQRGCVVDGHKYIDSAIGSGAAVIICDQLPKKMDAHVTFIQVEDTARSLAIMASNFYDNPSRKLKLIGVTGTNGKTTVASLLFELFKEMGHKSGLVSTVKIVVDTIAFETTHTTPDSLTINHYLDRMIANQVDYCFMEVSSHGIHQKRTEGLEFCGGIFTNLSHDHLDYHNSFSNYRTVKKRFFDGLPKNAFALSNLDDRNGSFILQNTVAKKRTYALKTLADYRLKILEKDFSGTLLSFEGTKIWTRLIGTFNAYNLLAIIGTASELGLDLSKVLTFVSNLESVSGRFECVTSKNGVVAIVDYAHTPDALKNVLATINDIRATSAKLVTVVGCGGDRDKTKRPKMARIASQLSTHVILTSDNPRTENIENILKEMQAGVSSENDEKVITIKDRSKAIKTGCKLASPRDVLLIAGKGHENYQEINGHRSHFSDLAEVKKCFSQLKE